MKQFIVMLATLPIMLLFFAQFTIEQANSSKIAIFTDIVYSAREEAKQAGGFDEAALRKELSEKLGIPEEDFVIEASEKGSVERTSDGSRGIIYYKVVMPMEKTIAGKGFLNIKDNKKYGYKIESCTPSEYIK